MLHDVSGNRTYSRRDLSRASAGQALGSLIVLQDMFAKNRMHCRGFLSLAQMSGLLGQHRMERVLPLDARFLMKGLSVAMVKNTIM